MADRKIRVKIVMEGAPKAAKELKKVGQSTKNVTSAVSLANQELKRLRHNKREASKAAKELAQDQKKLTVSTKGMTNQFIKVNLASRGISRGIQLVSSAMAFGIKSAIDFEFTITKIGAISGIAGQNLLSLENTIRGIASQSPKTGTEVAQAALEMSKMGLAGKDLENSLEGVVGLSVALDEEVRTVGETMVSVKNVFQQDASELSDIADKMFTTLGNSALNLEKFRTAFSFAGASARMAGVSFEEVSAMMGVLADNGIKASTIGTQLRQVFTKLDDPTSKVSKLIGAQSLKTKGLSATLRSLIPILGDSGEAKKLFGQRAISVINILTKNIGKIQELKTETEGMTSKTSDASKALGDTMHGNVKKLSSAWGDLNIQMAKSFDAPMKAGLEGISAIIRGMTTLLKGGGEDAQKAGANRLAALTGNLGSQTFNKKDEKPFGFSTEDARKEQLSLRRTTKELAADKIIADEKVRRSKIKTLKEELDGMIEVNSLEALRAEHTGRILNFKKMISELEDKLAQSRTLKDPESEKISLTQILGLKKEKSSIDKAEKVEFEKSEKMFEDARIRWLKSEKEKQDESLRSLKIDQESVELLEQRLTFTQELTETLQEQSTIQTALIEGLASGVDAFSDAFVDMLGPGGTIKAFGEAMGNMLKQVVADIIKTTIKTLILKAILAAVGGGTPFIPSGTGTGGLANLVGDSGTSSLTGLPLFKASGFEGTVSQPTAFIAGEEGSEEVMIKPRAKTGKGESSKSGIIVNISGDVYGEEKFMEAVRTANENLERSTI